MTAYSMLFIIHMPRTGLIVLSDANALIPGARLNTTGVGVFCFAVGMDPKLGPVTEPFSAKQLTKRLTLARTSPDRYEPVGIGT